MMLLSTAASAMQGRLVGQDVPFTSVGSDSRNIVKGQLFIALKGENFDGHDYAAAALQQGAAAVLISHEKSGLAPAIVVEDSYLALGRLAAYWRAKLTMPLVAITGSNGKTTVKEMISAILAETAHSQQAIHATVGNLNNHIGLPLTLLKLRAQHQYAVIEMGMNHLGEIDYLTRIAKPTVAVITNAGAAHIGELGSFANIAQAKGEIFAGLAEHGLAVINADDEYADYWKSLNQGRKMITFALTKPADVSASYQANGSVSLVNLTTPEGKVSFNLTVLGRHNISNALAASAVAVALGVSNADIARGLANFSAVKGRLQVKAGWHGAQLIDDSYNANPDSMKAAIDVLASLSGEKFLVLGDMGELGMDAKRLHREIGAYAKAAGLKALYCLGELSHEMVNGFGEGATHYATPKAIAEALKPLLKESSTVLVKGSRFMKMEILVDLLEEKLSATVILENQACY